MEEEGLDSHRIQNMHYYMINGFHKPDFVVDITSTISKSWIALGHMGANSKKSGICRNTVS